MKQDALKVKNQNTGLIDLVSLFWPATYFPSDQEEAIEKPIEKPIEKANEKASERVTKNAIEADKAAKFCR